MKGLPTLIRLKQNELDALRVELVQKQQLLDQLILVKARLIDALINEQNVAKEQPEIAGYFGGYAALNRKQQEDINEQITTIERQADKLRNLIADAFGELKKYELTAERIAEEAKKAANKREQNRLDEVSAQQFQQKQEAADG